MRQRLILVGVFLLVPAATLLAARSSTRLTKETIDGRPFAFSIEVPDRFHGGQDLSYRVAVRLKGERLSTKSRFVGTLTMQDGQTIIASCPVASTEKDGQTVYTFTVSERYLTDSTFTFGETLDLPSGEPNGRYYWFYLKDFAKAP
jgi:hypothetical protein